MHKLFIQPLTNLEAAMVKHFPFLNYTYWSTFDLNPYAHHLFGKHVVFLYTADEAVSSVFELLSELPDTRVWPNPTTAEAHKFIRLDAYTTIIVRPLSVLGLNEEELPASVNTKRDLSFGELSLALAYEDVHFPYLSTKEVLNELKSRALI